MNILESLYQEALTRGIAVEDYSLPQSLALAVQVGGKCYIGIDRARIPTSYEEAECLAHELGHYETGSFYALGERSRKKDEKRADEWAIRRLVPLKRFSAACRLGCREIWEFAEELGTSYAFAEKVVAYYLSKPPKCLL